MSQAPCDMGVGCDEAGVCYAAANGEPARCGRTVQIPAAVWKDVKKLAFYAGTTNDYEIARYGAKVEDAIKQLESTT